MSQWISDNSTTLLGWLFGAVGLVFFLGRIVQGVKTQTTQLSENVTRLNTTVSELSAFVHGQNGNAALAKSLDNLSQTLTVMGERIMSSEARINVHDVRLAKIDTVLEALSDMREVLQEHTKLLARIDERCAINLSDKPQPRGRS